jgi:hypothetical protein
MNFTNFVVDKDMTKRNGFWQITAKSPFTSFHELIRGVGISRCKSQGATGKRRSRCPCCSGEGIHCQNTFPPFKPGGAGPFPFPSPGSQPSTDRIIVNIFDHRPSEPRAKTSSFARGIRGLIRRVRRCVAQTPRVKSQPAGRRRSIQWWHCGTSSLSWRYGYDLVASFGQPFGWPLPEEQV